MLDTKVNGITFIRYTQNQEPNNLGAIKPNGLHRISKIY
jgi:hypothetical protein